MQNVYSSDDVFQTNLVLHQLQRHGVNAIILGQELNSVSGSVPFQGLVRIAVPDNELEKAYEVIKFIENENAETQKQVRKSDTERIVEYIKSALIIIFLLFLLILSVF